MNPIYSMNHVTPDRRQFIKGMGAAALLATLPVNPLFADTLQAERKFRMSLNPGAIGVSAGQKELLDMAVKHGFEAIVAMSHELIKWSDAEINEFTAQMEEKNIAWGAAGLPMDFRRDHQTHREGLKELPDHAEALQKAGVTRLATWIMPTHAELTYRENFHQHASRLKEIANILGYYNIKFGLEYVGPKTLMASQKFPFVHTMAECKELIAAIDEPNVGFLLDSFHWFCANDTKADLLTLDREQIVTADLNDAKKGRTRDEQIDNQRELPAATGVIDVKSFLEALVTIGYDGPVRAEPFNQPLNDMNNEEALKATSSAMKKAFGLL